MGVFYRPPSTDLNYMQELENSLFLIEGNENNLTVILLQDFNLPNIDWSVSSPSPLCSDSVSTHVCDMIDDNFLHEMIKVPTRGSNILDLVFVNKLELLTDVKVGAGLANSYHDSIEFDLKFKIAQRGCCKRLVYDYRNANCSGLRGDFANIPWNCIDLVSSIEDAWSSWKSLFFKAVERNNPFKFISTKRNVLGLIQT